MESLDEHGPRDLSVRVGRAGLRASRLACVAALTPSRNNSAPLVEHARAELYRVDFPSAGAMLAIVERFADCWGWDERAAKARRALFLLLDGKALD